MSNTVLTIALIANLILNVVILVRLHEMDWKCFSFWPTMEWSVSGYSDFNGIAKWFNIIF